MPKWLKLIIGILLLPACFGAASALSRVVSAAGNAQTFWIALIGGAACWLTVFLLLPKPMLVYVFGHELTHALWTWVCGGRVKKFKASAKGGHVVITRSNFLIALAPYFYPLYSLVVIVLYGVASLFYNVAGSTVTFLMMTPLQWLFFLLGATWAFHLSFTFWMIPKGQTDLTAHGTFFSLVIIYGMNLLILAIFLIVVAPEITFASFGEDLLHRAEDFSETAWRLLCAGWMRLAS